MSNSNSNSINPPKAAHTKRSRHQTSDTRQTTRAGLWGIQQLSRSTIHTNSQQRSRAHHGGSAGGTQHRPGALLPRTRSHARPTIVQPCSLFPEIMPAEAECPECTACGSAGPRTLSCEDAGRVKVLIKLAASSTCCPLCSAEAVD